MEKKGDILNQLAIIADLLEKANINSESILVSFELNSEEMKRMANEVVKLTKTYTDGMDNNFIIKIGQVEWSFSISKNSV